MGLADSDGIGLLAERAGVDWPVAAPPLVAFAALGAFDTLGAPDAPDGFGGLAAVKDEAADVGAAFTAVNPPPALTAVNPPAVGFASVDGGFPSC